MSRATAKDTHNETKGAVGGHEKWSANFTMTPEPDRVQRVKRATCKSYKCSKIPWTS